jgi:hypothetical protein
MYLFQTIYKPTIVFRMNEKSAIITKTNTIKKSRNRGILNKFRKGDRIIKINPIKLLIKNLG